MLLSLSKWSCIRIAFIFPQQVMIKDKDLPPSLVEDLYGVQVHPWYHAMSKLPILMLCYNATIKDLSGFRFILFISIAQCNVISESKTIFCHVTELWPKMLKILTVSLATKSVEGHQIEILPPDRKACAGVAPWWWSCQLNWWWRPRRFKDHKMEMEFKDGAGI